ncbi:uncharacterized protein LOC117110363 [Anneissia japonica]|uniref:uncharacterized protein LOC117110363 n=1 Tax=Anneissia japonica TaxID=1529436 RepID=UPI00142590E3|nr:uncharacterized protein LOC117110363 [Anneissia japonica]
MTHSIFKKGDRHNLEDYRGIPLNSCVAKVYSTIISQTLSEFIENNDISTEVQGEFRKDRRCEDYIFTLTSIIATRQAEGKKTFLDFRKPFDTVSREGVMKALEAIGIKGNYLFNIIRNVYENINCKGKFGDIETEFF